MRCGVDAARYPGGSCRTVILTSGFAETDAGAGPAGGAVWDVAASAIHRPCGASPVSGRGQIW